MAAHKSVTEPKVIFMLVHIWVWQVLNWHIVGRICISKFGDVRLQTGHTPIFVDSKCFWHRIQNTMCLDQSHLMFQKAPRKPYCFHILIWTYASRGLTFSEIYPSKSRPKPMFSDILTGKCVSRHNSRTVSTSGLPKMVRTRPLAPQERPIFPLNSQTWPEQNGVFCIFWLGPVLRAKAASSKTGPRTSYLQICSAPQPHTILPHPNS